MAFAISPPIRYARNSAVRYARNTAIKWRSSSSISPGRHSVSDFFAQQLTVTLTQPIGGLPYCVIGHPEFARSLRR